MIYVMSDIHGNKERFDSICKQIKLQADDTLYILGDVIDRYADGIEILQQIMKTDNIKMLLGNHEYMMLNSFYGADKFDLIRNRNLWYDNHGKVTESKFLLLDSMEQEKILAYLNQLPLNIDIHVNDKPYKLVHASPVELYDAKFIYDYKNVREFAVWNRILNDIKINDSMIVFGHTPTIHYQKEKPMSIFKREHLIGIDCGSGYPKEYAEGRLACLRLDDGKEFYSEM